MLWYTGWCKYYELRFTHLEAKADRHYTWMRQKETVDRADVGRYRMYSIQLEALRIERLECIRELEGVAGAMADGGEVVTRRSASQIGDGGDAPG
jgi:hypothetical protein